MKKLAICFSLLIGLTAGFFVREAKASRGSSGTYSLPTGNPVTTHNVITSTWANSTLADIQTELTNSLDRNGRGGMRAPLLSIDGTQTSPEYSFTSEPTSGIYRKGAGNVCFATAGADRACWSSSGETVTTLNATALNATTLAVTGTSTLSGSIGAGMTPSGSYQIELPDAVAASADIALKMGTAMPLLLREASPQARAALAWNTLNPAGTGELFVVGGYGAKFEYDNTGILRFWSSNTAGTAGAVTAGNTADRFDIDKTGTVTVGGTLNVNATLNVNNVSATTTITGATVTGTTVNGTTVNGATVNATGSLVIGGGTSISKSLRAAASWTPGTVSSGTCKTLNITVTGTATGADCIFGLPAPNVTPGTTVSCSTGAVDTCTINICYAGAGGFGAPAGNYTCRTFNP